MELFNVSFEKVIEGKSFPVSLTGEVDVFWGTFFEKRTFCLLEPSKQISFLTISNNFFSKT